jgi:hypothetical protein
MDSNLKLRNHPVLWAAIGVVVTIVLAVGVVLALQRTGDAQAVSDNAPLIAAVIALGGVFTAQMVSIALEQQRTRETRELEDRRTKEARDLEAQRAGEAALQNYFEQVGELLIEKKLHRASLGDNLSTVVRAQTLSVLVGLDPDRKRMLLLSLYESGLISKGKPVVNLAAAKLSKAKLYFTKLGGANLKGTDLTKARLGATELTGADLRGAKLSGAKMRFAKLGGADLSGTDLSNAYLGWAQGMSGEQLERQAYSLESAAMPNNQTYEEWLKSQGRKEDGENGGP